MRDQNQSTDAYPHPVSDPEAEGLPGTADDDSTAWDDVATGRSADGPDPAQLPADQPVAVDRFGTTAEEARVGESLDYKLAREYPDGERADLAGGGEPAPDEGDALSESVDRADPAALADEPPVDPATDSQVSMYDRDAPPRMVGRLVEPDQGAGVDDEPDAIAYDAGAAGGGPTAEEAAMHEVPEP